MKTIRVTVLGEPVAKGRPRYSRSSGRAYTPERTVRYESLVRTEYEVQSGFRFDKGSMLQMSVVAYFGIPRSCSKKRQGMMASGLIRPTKRPDSSNILKAIEDALNGVAYYDDCQIVDSMVKRFYSDTPRVEITIRDICQ